MKLHRWLTTLSLILILGCLAVSAAADDVPEGYPAIRIDPNTGLAYDLGGQTVYIYDYWTSTNWADETPTEEAVLARNAYRHWLETTYNCTIVQIAKGNWGTNLQELENYVSNPDGTLCMYILPADYLAAAMSDQVVDTWSITGDELADEKWNSAVVGLTESDGETYTLAAGKTEPRQMLFFNKTLLTAAEYDWQQLYDMQSAGTWNWDAFEAVLQQVDDCGIYGITGNGDDFYRIAVFANGGAFFDTDSTGSLTVAATDEKAVSALNWAKRVWSQYRRPQLEGDSWDYYNQAWINGEAAFLIGQGYNSSLMSNISWGCVAFPKGTGDGARYTTIAHDNVTVLPKVYDADMKRKLSVIYDLWTNPTPGYAAQEEIPSAYAENGDAAETYRLLQQEAVGDRTILLGSINDILGADFLWSIEEAEDVEELISQKLPLWEVYCRLASGEPIPPLTLANGNAEITFYMGLPGMNAAWSQNSLASVRIEDYMMQSIVHHDSEPEFTVVQTSGEPINFYWNLEDNEGEPIVDVRLDEIPDHEMDAELTITCNWKGEVVSTVTAVHIRSLTVIPEGTDTPSQIILDLNETFTIAPQVLPAGCAIPGHEWRLVLNSGEFEEFTEEDETQSTLTSRTYTAVRPGIYPVLVALQADTVIAGRFVMFMVRDENGNLPEMHLSNSGMHLTWFTGLPQEIAGDSGSRGREHIGQMWMEETYIGLADGNTAQWSLELVSGPDNFTIYREEGFPDSAWFREIQPKDSLTPGTSEYRMICEYAGYTFYGDITVDTVALSEIPAGFNFSCVPFDPEMQQRGEPIPVENNTLTVRTGDFFFLRGTFDNDLLNALHLNISDQECRGWFHNNEINEYLQNGEIPLVADEPGIYSLYITLYTEYGNLETRMPLTLCVTDENGILPDVTPDVRYIEEVTSTLLPDGAGEYGYWVDQELFNFGIMNLQELEDVLGSEFSFDFEVCAMDGSALEEDILTLSSNITDNYMSINIDEPPQSPMDIMVVSTLAFGDRSWQYTAVAHFVSQPLPSDNGLESEMLVRVGDTLDFHGMFTDANGNKWRDEFMYTYMNPSEVWEYINAEEKWEEHDYVSYSMTFLKPGIVSFVATLRMRDLYQDVPVTITILRADGTFPASEYASQGTVLTLPADLTRIEEEAFAGTAFTEIDIPAGVTFIADDAFEGSNLKAIYTHSQYAVEYALAHGFFALAD